MKARQKRPKQPSTVLFRIFGPKNPSHKNPCFTTQKTQRTVPSKWDPPKATVATCGKANGFPREKHQALGLHSCKVTAGIQSHDGLVRWFPFSHDFSGSMLIFQGVKNLHLRAGWTLCLVVGLIWRICQSEKPSNAGCNHSNTLLIDLNLPK